jgi:hypothetical protein
VSTGSVKSQQVVSGVPDVLIENGMSEHLNKRGKGGKAK